MFDDLPVLAPPKLANLGSKLTCYLSTEVEHVTDPIAWWYERSGSFPCLSHMALDYLSIPGEPFVQREPWWFINVIFTATSVDVERLFSHGHLLLTHVHSWLSIQSTCALLCLRTWSKLKLIKDDNVRAISNLPKVLDDKEVFESSWDAIHH